MVIRQFKLLIPFILFTFVFESCILDKSNEEVVLSGKVVDSSSGVAISDVNISVELVSDKIYTKTSSNGNYYIVIAHGGTACLVFSKEGYTSYSIEIVFKEGASKTIDVKMNTLEQDAYFLPEIKLKKVSNKQGAFSFLISTNVTFGVECKEDWVSIQKGDNSVVVVYKDNETEFERTAIIRLIAEYGIVWDITLTQDAGPNFSLT